MFWRVHGKAKKMIQSVWSGYSPKVGVKKFDWPGGKMESKQIAPQTLMLWTGCPCSQRR